MKTLKLTQSDIYLFWVTVRKEAKEFGVHEMRILDKVFESLKIDSIENLSVEEISKYEEEVLQESKNAITSTYNLEDSHYDFLIKIWDMAKFSSNIRKLFMEADSRFRDTGKN